VPATVSIYASMIAIEISRRRDLEFSYEKGGL
jgi:hypothetical protein